MPLHEVDPNLARRNSRSSTTSAKTNAAPGIPPPGMPSGAAGVLSMLKTGTETGDIGAFSMNTGRFPKLPKTQPHAARNAGPSRTSSQYSRHNSLHGSVRSAKSQHSVHSTRSGRERPPMPGEWPYSHRSRMNAHDPSSMYQSDARSSLAQESVRSMPISSHDTVELSDRSYSLTHSIYPRGQLNMQRSMTSLRSQPEPIQSRPRPPHHMPGPRFPQGPFPGHRPASPALSDTAAAFHGRRPMRPHPGPRSYTSSPVPSIHGYRGLPKHEGAQQYRQKPSIEELKRSFVAGGMPQRVAHQHGQMPPARPVHQPIYPPSEHERRLPPRPIHTNNSPRATRSEDTFRPSVQTQGATASRYAQYGGFVQRVKNVLEERMVVEQPSWPARSSTPSLRAETPKIQSLTAIPPSQSHYASAAGYMATNAETTEAHAAQDLPEVDDLHPQDLEEEEEVHAPDSPTVKRLTRDMIKAGMDGMSDIIATSSAAGDAEPETNNGEFDYSVSQSVRNSSSEHDEDTSNANERPHSQEGSEEAGPQQLGIDEKVNSAAGEAYMDKNSSSPTAVAPPSTAAEWTSPATESKMQRSMSSLNAYATPPSNVYATPPSGRPSSYPSEHSQEIVSVSAGVNRHTMPPQANITGGRNAHEMTDIDREQHALDVNKLWKSSSEQSQSFELNRQSNDMSTRSSVDGPTKVTIIPSSPTTSNSFNLFDESNRHDRGFRPSSLGTVEESEYEPFTTSPTTSESVEITSPRASMRSSNTHDTARRASNTNDGATSAMRNFHFPLPDLTEDSQEDASTTNLRMLGHKGHGFRGRGGFKDFRKAHRTGQPAQAQPVQAPQLPEPEPVPEPVRSYFGKALRDTHNLPSFNFSRHDLTAKMNAALGLRNSRSLEDLNHLQYLHENNTSSLPPVERPMSANMVRERYRSFFVPEYDSLDEFLSSPQKPSIEITKSSTQDDELIHEIERLSIPSVKNLSMRLSELFPSIRTSQAMLDLDKVDEALSRTVQEIRGRVAEGKAQLTNDVAPGSSVNAMSSPVTRQGTLNSDGTIPLPAKSRKRSDMQLDKDLPPLPKQADTERSSSSSDQRTYESARDSNDTSEDVDTTEESSSSPTTADGGHRPQPSRDGQSRAKSQAKAPKKGEYASPESTPRPWNNPENYPWSEDTETADVTLSNNVPEVKQERESRSKHKLNRSHSSPHLRRGGDTLRVIRSMSPGFDAELVPTINATESKGSDGQHKKGVWRSISRKRAKTSQTDRSEAAIDPHFFHPEERRESAVNVGDRYPTSALRQPPGLSIDESRSYFSDDSDDEHHDRQSRRRRFTRLRGKRSMPGVSASPRESPNGSRSGYRRTSNQDSMVFVDAPHASADELEQDRPPGGMSKAEFHAKRFVEKLRVFFFKGGEALKHLSKNRRHDREELQPYAGA